MDTLASLALPLSGEPFLHPLTLACSQPYFKCLRNRIGFCEGRWEINSRSGFRNHPGAYSRQGTGECLELSCRCMFNNACLATA